MQFLMIATVVASAAFALALPGGGGNSNGGGNVELCPTGLYSNPLCCTVDVLGVADLDCDEREFSLQL
jgi:hypothetical protein